MLANAHQFRARFESEDVEMSEEEDEETEEEEKETEQNMEESGNDVKDLEEDEDRPNSPLKRTEEQQTQEWCRPSRAVRSDRPNKGVKPCRFREV